MADSEKWTFTNKYLFAETSTSMQAVVFLHASESESSISFGESIIVEMQQQMCGRKKRQSTKGRNRSGEKSPNTIRSQKAFIISSS